MSPAASKFLDLARWIATLLVALHHTHNVFVNHADIMTAPHAWPAYVWWFVTAFPIGHAGLVMFFVISGFLVGGLLVEKVRAGQPFLRSYFIDRAIRINVVLYPALVLTLLMDSIGARIFPGPDLLEIVRQGDGATATTFVANLFNLQGIWFSPFGSNGPLWSLGVEFWYYMIAPLLLLPLSAAYAKGWRIAAFALGLTLFVVMTASGSYFLFGFWLWALGALVRIAPRPVMRSRWLALALWIGAVCVLRLIVRLPAADAFPHKYIVDFITSLMFANLLLTLQFDPVGFRWARPEFHKKFADFTYSIYAMHLPVAVWMAGFAALAYGVGWRRELATPLHYAWTIGSVAVMVLAGFLLSRVTEQKTGALRQWARRVLPGGAPGKMGAKRI